MKGYIVATLMTCEEDNATVKSTLLVEDTRRVSAASTRSMSARFWRPSMTWTLLDARRRRVDPRNNKTPMPTEAKERLKKFFETEPTRLENWYANLLSVYQDAFGQEDTTILTGGRLMRKCSKCG